MKKRFLKTLIVVALSATILSGCGKSQNDITDESVTTENYDNQNSEQGDSSANTENGGTPAQSDSGDVSSDSGNASAKKTDPQMEAGLKILENGTLLFSGNTDEGYYPGTNIDWLKNAADEDAIVIIYACDDTSHGGWGVLGIGCNVGGKRQQIDIAAYADMPDKERAVFMTLGELANDLGAASVAELETFDLGAWNGGRIAGLYYISGDVNAKYQEYMAQIAEENAIKHGYDGSLSNPNSIENAKVVYDYLKDIWGEKCLTGQMESTWMGSPDYEMDYIMENTGKLPAIRGLDFMHNDFDGVVKRSKEWWDKGGIVTICWHTGATFASGYDESKADNINWDQAFTEGTETYNNLIAGMDRAVPYLQELEDAGVPVLWRPFHELDGGWFWWSKGGSDNFKKLWQMMYNHYTYDCGLDNLIWVYGYSGNNINMADWYPGDEYIDLVGADSYTPGANKKLYEGVVEVAAENMPIVYHECGNIPTESEMLEAGTDWLYFMTWHTNYITDKKYNKKDTLNEIYNSNYYITLDELPAFK